MAKSLPIPSVEEIEGKLEAEITSQLDGIMIAVEKTGGESHWVEYLETQKCFWNLSWNNTVVLCLQDAAQARELERPRSSRFNSFKGWKSTGRQVRRGEKGMWICVPRFKKDDGGESKLIGFKWCRSYFGSAQVDEIPGEAKPLNLDFLSSGDVSDGLWTALLSVFAKKRIQHTIVPNCDGGAHGVSFGGRVEIGESGRGQMFSTSVHELAHEMMHWTGKNEDGSKKRLNPEHTRSVAEVEAESVSWIVSSHFGLDMSKSRFYLKAWGQESRSGEKSEREMIQKSLERIKATAKKIIMAIEEELGEE